MVTLVAAPRNLGFLGRDKIFEALDEKIALAKGIQHVCQAALCGIGGVG
jgi:hypothetical protein